MAGMTATAFSAQEALAKGCGLVVTEMVSSEGLVRSIGRSIRGIYGGRALP